MTEVRRFLLGGLLALVAVSAFGGGLFGILGAEGVPREWLRGTPFDSYFVPSLILLVVVSGGSLVAAVVVFRRHRLARPAGWIAGGILLVWIAAQLAIIGYVSWLQPAYFVIATLIIALATALRRWA
ncbi:MAG TPA: hypothetical protein VLS88_15385 [Polyangiales bacterium]|nr:hypothetical protein [Polyangiales bacterium]